MSVDCTQIGLKVMDKHNGPNCIVSRAQTGQTPPNANDYCKAMGIRPMTPVINVQLFDMWCGRASRVGIDRLRSVDSVVLGKRRDNAGCGGGRVEH